MRTWGLTQLWLLVFVVKGVVWSFVAALTAGLINEHLYVSNNKLPVGLSLTLLDKDARDVESSGLPSV